MSDHTTDNETEQLPATIKPVDESLALAAEIVVSKDRPNECTIFPPNPTDFDRMTTWITAKEGSFVSLDAVW